MLCRFQNINYRVNTQFVLFTGGIGNVAAPAYNIVAQSPIIVNSVPNQPVQASHPSLVLVGRICDFSLLVLCCG